MVFKLNFNKSVIKKTSMRGKKDTKFLKIRNTTAKMKNGQSK